MSGAQRGPAGGAGDGSHPQVLHPPGWKPPAGYADGVAATGRIVVTAGQIGWNPVTAEIETDDFAQQAAQALRNIVTVLASAGARPDQLVRLTWFVTSRDEYLAARRSIGGAYREIVGSFYPAMSVLVVSALLEPRAKVEIEATAVIPG